MPSLSRSAPPPWRGRMADMATPTAPQAPVRRGADWLESWTPEDPENWDSGQGVEDPVGHHVQPDAGLHHLVPRLCARPGPEQHRIRPVHEPALLAHGDAGPGGREPAPRVDVPAAGHRDAQARLDEHAAVPVPARRLGDRGPEPRHALRDPAVAGGHGGDRRRRVQRVHARVRRTSSPRPSRAPPWASRRASATSGSASSSSSRHGSSGSA